jgi:hypothetical protein
MKLAAVREFLWSHRPQACNWLNNDGETEKHRLRSHLPCNGLYHSDHLLVGHQDAFPSVIRIRLTSFIIRASLPLADCLLVTDPLDRKMPSNGYTTKVQVFKKYNIVGFISSGTYGRVYKAEAMDQKFYTQNTDGTYPQRELFAIKK